MAKKIKHLPPDLPYPSMIDKVDFTTINGQELFFTPLRFGKSPDTKDWTNKGMSMWDSLNLISKNDNSYTGFGLNNKLSNTVAFDIDDVKKTVVHFKQEFNDNGETLESILDNSFRIKSPKANRDKAIFMLTEDQLKQLDEIEGNQIVQHTEDGAVVFEIRGRGGQDVFPPSLYLAEDKGDKNDK